MDPPHQVDASENEGSDYTHETLSGEVSGQVENFNIQTEGLTDSLLEKNDDFPANKLSDLMKLSNIQTTSTQSLLNVVKTLLDENIEKTNAAGMPMRVASLLKFTMQEIELRVSKQSEDLRKQSGLNKSREDRYQTKLRALETLAVGATEENKIIMNQLQQMKAEKARTEEERKLEHQDMMRLLKEKTNYEIQISSMNQELDLTKKTHEDTIIQMKSQSEEKISSVIQELDLTKKTHEDNIVQMKSQYDGKISSVIQELDLTKKTHEDNIVQMKSQYDGKISSVIQELDLTKKTHEDNMVQLKSQCDNKISSVIQELDLTKKTHEDNIVQLKLPYEETISSMIQELDLTKKTHEDDIVKLKSHYEEKIVDLERKITELESFLADSMKKVKKLEECSESKYMTLKRKELDYKHFMDSHIGSIQDLKKESDIIKQEMLKTKRFYVEELCHLELELKDLVDAAQNYRTVLDENRRLYNEVQDLKGNIRVYCRIRPFHPSQSKKETTMDYIGENGELVVANPLKQGKDTHRMFKFNKVFGPDTTQEDVFQDTQPLIRSVLDGFNVCIFAYGQTGSGKTYTMTGPSSSSVEDWGVNYRAVNDLFNISQSRKSSVAYEVGVQMVEIYNEQVRDLLSNGSSPKRLEIWNTTQPNGLAVPDATMHDVKSTADVLELMNIGLMNRAIGATALNERSSRSHSVLTVHVRGTDLETNVTFRGNLHLVDLAGSERVDRTEATGDRLREAQHINKSLSALGDVIFALAQKSPHVPYRNSKLTQLLQSSLGGQAKTLMFVQLNPDVESYSESVSTLKFAERVSGVELGAARTNKEGRGVRELMEQVALLKESISQKDAEIGKLRHLKTNVNGEKRMANLPRNAPPRSPRRNSLGPARQLRRTTSEQSCSMVEKLASESANSSDYSDKHSEAGSQLSTDDLKHHKEFFRQKELEVRSPPVADLNDMDLLRFEDGDEDERLSDISDSVLSMGTETDGSNSIVEYTLFPETSNLASESPKRLSTSQQRPKSSQKVTGSSRPPSNKISSKASSSKKTNTVTSSSVRSSKRWQ